MITRASHWDKSAFFTTSRAWFWCSVGDRVREKRDNIENVGQTGKIRTMARAEKEKSSLHHQPLGQDLQRLGCKAIQFRHIILANPRQLRRPENICGYQTSVCSYVHSLAAVFSTACVLMCACKCWLMCWDFCVFSMVLLATFLSGSLCRRSLWGPPTSISVYSSTTWDSPV